MKPQFSRKKDVFWGLTAFLFMLMIAFSGWYFAQTPEIKKLDAQALNDSIDLRMNNILIQKFNQNGELEASIQSPYLEHKPHNNSHFIHSPHIMIKEGKQPPILITATTAIALGGGKTIQFEKNVHIYQPGFAKKEPLMIDAEQLIYTPKEKRAFIPTEMTYQQGGILLHSKSMQATLGDTQTIHLTKANAIYETRHS